jgi:uncharacterized protein (DUF1501 family)
LQGSAPALAIGQLGQFGIRAGQQSDDMANAFASQYAQAADALLGSTGREAFDAVRMLKEANPGGYTAANGAQYPRSGFGDAMRQIAQIIPLVLEVAFAELGQWDHHANEGGSTGQIANRSTTSPRHRGVRQGHGRSHGRRGRGDDVRIRPHGEGERQPRHGSRTATRC